MLKQLLFIILLESAYRTTKNLDINLFDEHDSLSEIESMSPGSQGDDDFISEIDRMEEVCNLFKVMATSANREIFQSDMTYVKRALDKYQNGNKATISNKTLQNEHDEMIKVLSENFEDETLDLGTMLGFLVHLKDDCFSSNELDFFVYNLITKGLVKDLNVFLENFLRKLEDEKAFSFIRSNLHRFLDCESDFLDTVATQFKKNRKSTIYQFRTLYKFVVVVVKARAEDSLSRNTKKLIEDVLRSGGIYALLYVGMQNDISTPNDDSSLVYKTIYNLGLLCIANMVNRFYNFLTKKSFIANTYFGNNGQCLLKTRDLDELANEMRKIVELEDKEAKDRTIAYQDLFEDEIRYKKDGLTVISEENANSWSRGSFSESAELIPKTDLSTHQNIEVPDNFSDRGRPKSTSSIVVDQAGEKRSKSKLLI